MIIGDNFNQVYKELIRKVHSVGIKSAPRGMPVKELIGQGFVLTNPKRCLTTLKSRKLNYQFAMVEKLEYLSGQSSPDRLGYYNKQMLAYLNPQTGAFDGAYGPRLLRQYDYVLDLLKRDPDTRQAILNINQEVDKHETLDVPCTIALQFLLRDNKLHMVAYMRSNDLLWGTPYDVNGFCFLLEAFAYWLGVEVGTYTHVAGSLHYYINREPHLLQVMTDTEEVSQPQVPFEMTREHWLSDLSWRLWPLEFELRNGIITKEALATDGRYQEASPFTKHAIQSMIKS